MEDNDRNTDGWVKGADLIRKKLRDAGYTQKSLADHLGISQSELTKRLNTPHYKRFTPDELANTADYTGMNNKERDKLLMYYRGADEIDQEGPKEARIRPSQVITARAIVVGGIIAGGIIVVAVLLLLRGSGDGQQCIPNSRFKEDVNVPDKTVMRPGEQFVKEWRLENPADDGLCRWTKGYNAVWVARPKNVEPRVPEVRMAQEYSYDIPPTDRGKQAIIKIPMTAPREPGQYKSTWQLRSTKGQVFGDEFWVWIVVQE